MRCFNCHDQYIEKYGDIVISNDFIGDYNVKGVKYYECPSCGKKMFHRETSIKISEREKEIKSRLIEKLPIGEFILPTEAANILGVSRQALHKNQRINNGFVYYTEKAGKRLYHKKSVEMFRQSSDGRFNLAAAVMEVKTYIVFTAVKSGQKASVYKETFSELPARWPSENRTSTNSTLPH